MYKQRHTIVKLCHKIIKKIKARRIKMIKKLSKSIRQYKTASILTPIFVSLEVLTEVAIPYVVAMLLQLTVGINATTGSTWQIVGLIVALVVLVACAMIFGILSGTNCAKASTGFAKNLRQDMYDKIQTFSFANIDKFSTSSLITRMTSDVSRVQMAYQMIIRIAIRAPLMLVFSLVMTFVISPSVAWIFLITIPILFVALMAIMLSVKPIYEKVFKKYDRLNQVVQENVRGIRAVKAFVREDYEREKFNDVSEDIYVNFSKAEKIISFNSPVMKVAMYLAIILTCWFGAKLIVGSNEAMLQATQLSTLITYGIQLLSALMMISMVFAMIVISKEAGERIVEVLDEVPDIADPANSVLKVNDGSIEFNNVNFSYAKDMNKLCLSDVNISIKSGEVVGIIGGTGSSKTTLVQLIPRLYDATFGEVKVGGVNVKDYDIKVLRDAVSMVLQKNELFSGTIKDNLRWGNENATDAEMIKACKLAQADSFIEGFPDKYDTYIEQGGTNVSGGQKQRLCIARALLKSPKILILDDSTSAVDTKTDALIRENFAKTIPDTTKIIIAQRIDSIKDANKIIVLDGGKIADVGTHRELLNRCDIYREVYESQTKGVRK